MLKVWLVFTVLGVFVTGINAAPINIGVPLILSQDALLYQGAHPNVPVLSPAEQEQQMLYFKKQYFEPWAPTTSQTTFCFVPGNAVTCQSAKQTESDTLAHYVNQANSFYDGHYQLLPQGWTVLIANNMQLDTFPNVACTQQGGCRGILVDNVQLCSLPTNIEAFRNFLSPGEGYLLITFSSQIYGLGRLCKCCSSVEMVSGYWLKGKELWGGCQHKPLLK